MANETLAARLKEFGRRGRVLKPYNVWGSDKPCPPRLVVNVYKGCSFSHKYCYIPGCAKVQEGFRDHLTKRIKAAKDIGLGGTLVIVSSSTDPLQPIEANVGDSLFALDSLLSNDFPVLVMTRNPMMLLDKDYWKVAKNPRLYVDVSIPSTHENDPNSVFYSSIAPPLGETFNAMKELSGREKHVRVKIEPIIPSVEEIQGQTPEEIEEIVEHSSMAGVQKIISKTLRLNSLVPECMRDSLGDYYRTNGIVESYGNVTNLVLKPELRRQLLQPVYAACEEQGIPFCACVDADAFSGRTVDCGLGEQ